MSDTIERTWRMPVLPKALIRKLADEWERQWREKDEFRVPRKKSKRKPKRKKKAKPVPAFTVLDVAKEFGQPQAAVDFARSNLIPPWEWADELGEEFDLDVHELYEAYYDTDPATQGRLSA
jgi:hypothetical protein